MEAMEPEPTEEIPLSTLYLQIEYGNTPSAVLGLGSNASDLEVREAYRAIALKIHPDKAPSENLPRITHSPLPKSSNCLRLLARDSRR
jgi:hypothetical protein